MLRTRNTLFVALFCVFLCGPALLFAAQHIAKADLPDWLTVEEANYISGNKTRADVLDSLTIDSFLSKELQSSVEIALGNTIPAKGRVMLANASIQRAAILCANTVFGWDCFPSYFDSPYLIVTKTGTVLRESRQDIELGTIEFCAQLKDFAKRYPGKRFIVYGADSAYTLECNPSLNLISRTTSTKAAIEIMKRELDGIDNVYVIANTYSSLDEYYKDYFLTDFHWNSRGAIRAYNTIADQVGLPNLVVSDYESIPTVEYFGSESRLALVPKTEQVFDAVYDFGDLTIFNADGSSEGGSDHQKFVDSSSTDNNWDFYGKYYYTNGLIYKTSSAIGQGQAILITNSFGAAILRPLALPYENLYMKWDFAWTDVSDTTLSSYIAETDATDVYFVSPLADYYYFCTRKPNFFI